MGAMRKAGVWLGLVEDDESRAYERDYERTVDRRSDSYADKYDADDLEFEEDFEEPAPPPVPLRSREPRVKESRFADHVGARPNSRNVNSPTGSHMLIHDNLALAPQVALRDRSMLSEEAEAESESYRITTLHPNTYNEARVIGEHFREGIPVIMNLTEMDESDAKRLVDFSAGLAFGLRGSIERVTNRVFLLSPANVSVTAEDKARIAGGGFFNQS